MDEYAKEIYKEYLGLEEIPEKTQRLYRAVKLAHDKLSPGRLSPEALALIYALTVTPPSPPRPKEQ